MEGPGSIPGRGEINFLTGQLERQAFLCHKSAHRTSFMIEGNSVPKFTSNTNGPG